MKGMLFPYSSQKGFEHCDVVIYLLLYAVNNAIVSGLIPGDRSVDACKMVTGTNISVSSGVDTIIGSANITEAPCCCGLDICLDEGGCL